MTKCKFALALLALRRNLVFQAINFAHFYLSSKWEYTQRIESNSFLRSRIKFYLFQRANHGKFLQWLGLICTAILFLCLVSCHQMATSLKMYLHLQTLAQSRSLLQSQLTASNQAVTFCTLHYLSYFQNWRFPRITWSYLLPSLHYDWSSSLLFWDQYSRISYSLTQWNV